MNEEKIGPEYPVLNHIGAIQRIDVPVTVHEYKLGDLVSVQPDGRGLVAGIDPSSKDADRFVIGIAAPYESRFEREIMVEPVKLDHQFVAWEQIGITVHHPYYSPDAGQSIWQKENGYLGQTFGVNLVVA